MRLSEADFQAHCDNHDGFCTNCDKVTREGMTEPDASGYKCPDCKRLSVVGMELALIAGDIEVEDDV